MSRDILDLIDNAIASTTSEDAMRWTPDAEKVTETGQAFADLVREYEDALDAHVLGPQVGPALTDPAPAPIWTQIWREPSTQRVWFAPLGAPSPVGPIEDNPAWVRVDALATSAVSWAESLSCFLRHSGATIGDRPSLG